MAELRGPSVPIWFLCRGGTPAAATGARGSRSRRGRPPRALTPTHSRTQRACPLAHQHSSRAHQRAARAARAHHSPSHRALGGAARPAPARSESRMRARGSLGSNMVPIRGSRVFDPRRTQVNTSDTHVGKIHNGLELSFGSDRLLQRRCRRLPVVVAGVAQLPRSHGRSAARGHCSTRCPWTHAQRTQLASAARRLGGPRARGRRLYQCCKLMGQADSTESRLELCARYALAAHPLTGRRGGSNLCPMHCSGGPLTHRSPSGRTGKRAHTRTNNPHPRANDDEQGGA